MPAVPMRFSPPPLSSLPSLLFLFNAVYFVCVLCTYTTAHVSMSGQPVTVEWVLGTALRFMHMASGPH